MKPGKEYIYDGKDCAFIADESEDVYIAGNLDSEEKNFTKLDPEQFYSCNDGFVLKYNGTRKKIRVIIQCAYGGYFTGYEKEQTQNGVPLKPLLTGNQDLWTIFQSYTTKRKYIFDNQSTIYYNETTEELYHDYDLRNYFISNYQDYPQYIIDGNSSISFRSKSKDYTVIIVVSNVVGVALIITIIVVIVCYVKKKKKNAEKESSSSSTTSQQV